MSEFTNRIFHKALKHVFEKTDKFSSQKELAIAAGVSEGMISDMLSERRNYGERSHLKVANACEYKLDDFYKLGIAIEEGQPIGDIDPIRNKKKKKKTASVTQLTHDEIIRLFRDQPRARKINYMLAELEKMDIEGYAKAEGFITALYENIKILKKTPGEDG